MNDSFPVFHISMFTPLKKKEWFNYHDLIYGVKSLNPPNTIEVGKPQSKISITSRSPIQIWDGEFKKRFSLPPSTFLVLKSKNLEEIALSFFV